MDRQTVYAGQVPLETDLLNTNRNVLIAVGKMLSDMLGTSTYASGLGCVATAPASLNVQVQPGQLYALQNLDNTPYSSLAADTTHQIVKQGIALDATTLSCPAPTTAGFSINYLIEANYADVDTNAVVLPFYNASNPSQAYSGPGGNGQPSMTTRAGKVVLTLKAGVAAATGTQITPAVDPGCIGLWVVTVANGQSTITSANIAQYAGAPILPTSLLQSLITNNLEYGIDNGSANVVQATFPLPPTSLVDNQQFWVKIKAANNGATTFTPNPGVIAPAPVVGGAHAALQGSELAANGRALFVYRADIASYVLESCTGAALQTSPATQSQHALQAGQALGLFLGVQIFTSSGTYTPGNYTIGGRSVTATKAIVKAVGAGGGGGGASATSATQVSFASGGNAGAYGELLIQSGLSSQTVTIGAGGSAATAGQNNGGNGGSTSFGSLMVCAGGGGGVGAPAGVPPGVTVLNSTIAQVTGSGNIIASQPGAMAKVGVAVSVSVANNTSGGGDTPFGQGGYNQTVLATGYGAGGPGAGAGPNAASGTAGTTGRPGYLLVFEYA
jgi:hypothetical protein